MASRKRCKLSANYRHDFPSLGDHIHNQNLAPNPAISAAVPELPFDIITEILSWLPVESLLRFKCVCKKWYSLVLDCKFIAKHMVRASPLQLPYEIEWEPRTTTRYDANFKLVSNVAGLLLEESLFSRNFRIRNFATHQVLYLPDPPEGTRSMSFVVDTSKGECKLAGFHKKHEGEGEGEGDLGFEACIKVLSIGQDDHWRTLKVPNKNDRLFRTTVYGGNYDNEGATTHMFDFVTDGECLKLEIQSFDLWSECFTINTMPSGAFLDLKRAKVLRWYQYVAVADIVGEALNVMVLEDFKEHKWSKITVPLKFLKDNPDLKDQIAPAHTNTSGTLIFNNAVENNLLVYDLKREVIMGKLTKSSPIKGISFLQPSLVTLEGMRSEYHQG